MWTIEADGVSKHFPNGLAFYAAKDGKKRLDSLIR
jgi:hypothetical protein